MAREYFPAYHSYLEGLEALGDAECGRLFKACLLYSKTGEVSGLSGNERILFPSWKSQIDRDNAKYEAKCQKLRENGQKGGSANKQMLANASKCPPEAPKGKGKGKGEREYKEYIVAYLNEKTGKAFRASSKVTAAHIKARLAEGFSVDDFKTVIDRKVADWLTDPKMSEYLRPQTLFGTKFESYLNGAARVADPTQTTPPSRERRIEIIDGEEVSVFCDD